MTPFREAWFWTGLALYTTLAGLAIIARIINDRNMLTVFSAAFIVEYVAMFGYGLWWRFRGG